MFWVVRIDSFWYRCKTLEQAETHYQYVLDNINGKYKSKDKLYLAEYGGEHPRILKKWIRPQLEEEKGYGKY
jgi:hypothetical protein